MAKDFSGLISMTCPFRVNLIGTIHEIDDEVKFTRDDIGQKNVILHDASGFGVKLLCHGYWCEEPMERGQRWAICFGECRAEKAGEAVIWIFDSAYLLRLPDQDEPPVFREVLACCCCCCRRCRCCCAGAAGFQNVPLATPKHHATEGRNDLQKTCCPEA